MTWKCDICGEALPKGFVPFLNHFRIKHPELPEVKRLEKELEQEKQ